MCVALLGNKPSVRVAPRYLGDDGLRCHRNASHDLCARISTAEGDAILLLDTTVQDCSLLRKVAQFKRRATAGQLRVKTLQLHFSYTLPGG